MKKIICIMLAILFSVCMFTGCQPADNGGNGPTTNYNIFPKKENTIVDGQLYKDGEVQFDSSLWTTRNAIKAINMYDSFYDATGYYIKSAKLNGQDTYVFGYLCMPDVETDEPLPAIVLVHGGGGTAFPDLARHWANLGYVALSIDVEGRIPTPNQTNTRNAARNESPQTHGPSNALWSDSTKPYDQQWMYHAIAAVVSSVTFLANMQEVDETKIGCLGISWGSVVISASAVYDDRLAFCIPIYGSIGLSGTPSREGVRIDNYPRAVELWDRPDLLENCTTPFLFINSEKDHAFSQEVHSNCGKKLQNKQFLFIPELTHGHYQCMTIDEIENFADNICKNKNSALMQFEVAPTNTSFTFKMKGGTPVRAELYRTATEDLFATTTGEAPDWRYEELTPATDGTFTFNIPSGDKYYFITIYDANGLRVSTDLITM